MAAFTSTTHGDWNDGATWGNTSPGVKGTDWPGLAGDIATVASGTTVTYNVSEANELGAITINGKLIASRSMSTLLSVGNVDISIGATGELDFGTAASPIPKAYTCETSINSTSDNSIGIKYANGGKYSFCGADDYCTNYESTLANDADNTDGDATIVLNDDRSSDWHVGDEITIQREWKGDASSHTDAIIKRVIQSMSGTAITLTETVTSMVTGVGNTWTSTVVNVTRNVKIYKAGAVTDIQSSSRYNTNRPLFLDSTTGTNTNILSYCQFTGFYEITLNGATLTSVVIRNGERGLSNSDFNTINYCYIYGNNHQLYYCENCTVNYTSLYSGLYGQNNDKSTYDHCHIYCLNNAGYTNNSTLTSCSVHTCTYVSSYGAGVQISLCDLHSNVSVLSNAGGCKVTQCNIFKNTYVVYSCMTPNMFTDCFLYETTDVVNTACLQYFNNCSFGYDSTETSKPNAREIRNQCSDISLFNCKMPAAGLSFYDRNTVGMNYRIMSSHHDEVLNAFRIYDNKGDIIKTPCDGTGTSPSEDPDGGNTDCIEVSNLQSNLSTMECISLFNDKESSVYCTASAEKTFTYKMQSIFTNTLANTEVILEAFYMAGTDGALTKITSTGTIAARTAADDWTQSLSVTLTPAQTGFVFFQIKLCKYEPGKKLYVYPNLVIS